MSKLRIAVIGAHAVGLYTADLLMRCNIPLHIDIIDSAPAPLGLNPTDNSRSDNSPSTVRVLGNVDTAIENIRPFYHATIEARFSEELEVHEAVEQAIEYAYTQAQRPLSDFTTALKTHHIAYTVWDRALKLPTSRDLSDWVHTLAIARAVPVCV